MSWFVEAVVAMLPPDAGGRAGVVMPRDGSYCPFVRVGPDEPLLRVRFIEGPPRLMPGETARVVMELDSSAKVPAGTELEIVEWSAAPVGIATVCSLVPA